MKDPSEIILRPLLTEKSMAGLREGKYTFEVDKNATKIDIRNAIEALGRTQQQKDANPPEYVVQDVNTIVVKGKTRRTRRGEGRTADWKKAIVTVRPGARLHGILGEVFEGV